MGPLHHWILLDSLDRTYVGTRPLRSIVQIVSLGLACLSTSRVTVLKSATGQSLGLMAQELPLRVLAARPWPIRRETQN